MGIKDLLKFMKPYIKPIHIKKFAGMRVGIDAYSWLHKGAYSCSMELCLNSDSEKKRRYIDYFMHRINLLRHHKIIPVVVFDGGNIPCKAVTEQDRHRRKTSNHDLAMEKLKEGNVSAASEFFQVMEKLNDLTERHDNFSCLVFIYLSLTAIKDERAVSVTPSMAHQLIQILRSENIEFVVAPYEADAQLAYLSNLEVEKGGIVAVITEDSDLIAYGCKVIVFKMDRYGNGEEMLLDNVFNSVSSTPSFRNFDRELFTGMCVLAGCDFLPSVPGIGIAKSYALVSKYRNLDRVLSVLKLEKRNQMPEDYPNSFRQALAVFQHALIYDGEIKKLRHMTPLPETLLQSLDGELDFLGPEIPPSVAIAIAEGNVDPISMEAFFCSTDSRHRQDPIRIQTPGQPQRVEAPVVVSSRESCFIAFSNQKTSETYSAERQNPISNEEKCVNKVEALQKLITPSTINEVIEATTVPNVPLKVPDNNPFKRRKFNQNHSDQTGSQISCSTQVEDSENTVISNGRNKLQKVHQNGASRTRKLEEICLHKVEKKVCEQVSVVTQEENSEVLCLVSESQESVNSNANKITGASKRRGKIGKLKNSFSNSSDTKKSSILNFFSRVNSS